MARLSKQQSAKHAQAQDLLRKDVLTEDERLFVIESWDPSANHMNGVAGAFFTPYDLARDFQLTVGGRRIIDLCAGIGTLGRALLDFSPSEEIHLTCVEINPDYAAVGRKVLPEAEWIVADIFDPATIEALRAAGFDWAISNPPFGPLKRSGGGGRYTGKSFDLHVVDVAAQIASGGSFILPAGSVPFAYSGRQDYQKRPTEATGKFREQTGVNFRMNLGIDCDVYLDAWKGVSPKVEIAIWDPAEDAFDAQAEAEMAAARAANMIAA